jgi:putative hydrolase of the HAD superfamily
MSAKPWIGFDADDTLWHNENIFEKCHEKYFKLLSKYHDAGTVEKALFATEGRNLSLYGYGIKGYMLSAIETAIALTEGRIRTEELNEIIVFGRGMLEHPVELLEGTAEVLARLKSDYRILVITKGDLRDQERKVAKSGLAEHFDAVEVVSEKDPAAYQRVFDRHGIDPKDFLMVGNSVKSDIVPILELGGSGIHVPYRITWGHEHAEAPKVVEERLYEAKSLLEVPALIARWRSGLQSRI